MTRPQIITLELEDCSDALVEYVERLEHRNNELSLLLQTAEQNAMDQRDMKAKAREQRDEQVQKNAELAVQLNFARGTLIWCLSSAKNGYEWEQQDIDDVEITVSKLRKYVR